MVVIVIIGYVTTAAACAALLFIVRTFFNDTVTVAVWTSFHSCLHVVMMQKSVTGLH
jgi:hypothetical protein